MSQAPDPRLQQAAALLRSRKPADAMALCRQVFAETPDAAEAAMLLARIARDTGRADEGVRVLEAARRAGAAHPALEPELAASLVAANRAHEALPILQRIVAARPDVAPAHFWLGQAYLKLWRPAEGLRHLERALQLQPKNTQALFAIGAGLLSIGRPSAAEARLRQFLAAHPDSTPGLQALASALDYQNRADEAEELYRRVLARAPGYPPALTGLARVLQARGDAEGALALLSPAVGAGRADPALAAAYAGLCVAAGKAETARPVLDAALAEERIPPQAESVLRFAMARIEEAARHHDAAFEQFRRANDLFPRTFNRDSLRRFTDELIAAFSARALDSLPRASNRSERPVIVCGMPRSGTTLVEQIIASHPDAFGAGELIHLRAAFGEIVGKLPGRSLANLNALAPEQLDAGAESYLNALAEINADAARVVDKMPRNYEVLGLVPLMLPGARIIHCSRDPMDTCVSCYTTQLSPVHGFSNHLDDLGFAYGEYRRLMDHWRTLPGLRMLEVSYEELVADTEAGARRIIDFIGLPWDDRCLRFYENARVVSTASVDQVRRPIYTSSVARWRRYERHLGPLRQALREAGIEA